MSNILYPENGGFGPVLDLDFVEDIVIKTHKTYCQFDVKYNPCWDIQFRAQSCDITIWSYESQELQKEDFKRILDKLGLK